MGFFGGKIPRGSSKARLSSIYFLLVCRETFWGGFFVLGFFGKPPRDHQKPSRHPFIFYLFVMRLSLAGALFWAFWGSRPLGHQKPAHYPFNFYLFVGRFSGAGALFWEAAPWSSKARSSSLYFLLVCKDSFWAGAFVWGFFGKTPSGKLTIGASCRRNSLRIQCSKLLAN